MVPLHPAERRGLRELYAAAGELIEHWGSLGRRLPAGPTTDTLADGIETADGLLAELKPLTAARGLNGFPAATGLGRSLARSRTTVADRFLERNQALRLALLDVQHLTTLLGYLAELARTTGGDELAEFCERWQGEMLVIEHSARDAAARIGDDPDAAIEPLDRSPAGRAAHGAAYLIGSFGEWFDRRTPG